jgi:hypothetical protein
MSRLFRHRSQPFAFAIGLTALVAIAVSAQIMGTPERYTASAINMNNGAAGTIDIAVDRH